MSQYIDFSYNSCLEFVGNFKITCNSLITPLTSLQTMEEYIAGGFTQLVSCDDMMESECVGGSQSCDCEDEDCDFTNDSWQSNYCE